MFLDYTVYLMSLAQSDYTIPATVCNIEIFMFQYYHVVIYVLSNQFSPPVLLGKNFVLTFLTLDAVCVFVLLSPRH